MNRTDHVTPGKWCDASHPTRFVPSHSAPLGAGYGELLLVLNCVNSSLIALFLSGRLKWKVSRFRRCDLKKQSQFTPKGVAEDSGGKLHGILERSGWRESNPHSWLGKPVHYHYATAALRIRLCLGSVWKLRRRPESERFFAWQRRRSRRYWFYRRWSRMQPGGK